MRAAGDTIVAVATPAGTGAIGVVRLSGPRAVEITSGVVRLTAFDGLRSTAPRRVYKAAVVDPGSGALLDEALVVRMEGPRSYSGEDVVELSCHGNPVLLCQIVRFLLDGGARLAEPGEFTRRAFLSGRLDLLQVEAVAQLIGARTDRAVRLAASQLRGGLSSRIQALYEGALDLVAELEVALDFPDDEFGLSLADAGKRAMELSAKLDALARSARQNHAIQDGLAVMLTGAPNVGKSSLLNALLGTERAIVAATPGTTRDVIDGVLVVSGVPVRLADGAGLGGPQDPIDAEGMRRARKVLSECDLALVVLDRSRVVSDADREVLSATAGMDRLVVANKADLPSIASGVDFDCVCSALTCEGVDLLHRRLGQWVESRISSDGDEAGVMASLRVIDRLESAAFGLRRAAEVIPSAPLEVGLVDLRATIHDLEEVLGIDGTEAVLDRIFSTFCVGK